MLMFLFGFELDTLEIALREQQDLVDKIFLVESSATHRGVRQPPSQLSFDQLLISDTQTSHMGETEIQPEIQFCELEQAGSRCCG